MAVGGYRGRQSPIPADPGYENDMGFDYSGSFSYRPRGRTRPKAEAIARQQNQGTIANLLFPEATPRVPPHSSRYKSEFLILALLKELKYTVKWGRHHIRMSK